MAEDFVLLPAYKTWASEFIFQIHASVCPAYYFPLEESNEYCTCDKDVMDHNLFMVLVSQVVVYLRSSDKLQPKYHFNENYASL